MRYDLAIIGGGPAGYNAAEKAAVNGLKTILFEKNAVGGVCLNEGCIPTKTLLYSAKVLYTAQNAAKYGVIIDNDPQFDFTKMMDRKNKVVKQLVGGVAMKLKGSGVTTIEGQAFITGEANGSIQITANNETYEAEYLLVCTGSETVIPPIKGLSDISYWTSKEALECKELPKTLSIIGGGVIGMEFAALFNSLGVKINVIEMAPEILGAMDKETSAMLRKEFTKRGIKFYMDCKVTEVTANSVIIENKGKVETIDTDTILVSVGRRANFSTVGLDNLKVELLRNGVKVDEHMQTSHPKVYACGDITGQSLLAHTALREGEVAINNILGVNDKMSYKAIPGVVYTNPEIAGLGKTEEELKANNEPYRVLKLPMAYSGRFIAENEGGSGICKIIVDNNERVIGCHILGNPASEMIAAMSVAVEEGFTLDEFKKIVFPHPTVSEIIHDTLFA